MGKRLPPRSSEWINRSAPIEFQFEGRTFAGYQGDVLTSALWASNERVTGRSFKYHRPRSSYSLSGYDANVIVEDDLRTNLRGDFLPIEPGLNVSCVNTRGSVYKDIYRVTEWFSRFLPVGFYYKAFHTPQRLFPYYERQMRKMAGLGQIRFDNVPKTSPKDYAFSDVLVVGAGPSGLAAALAAANHGVSVLVVDEGQKPGGSLCWQNVDEHVTLDDLLQQVKSMPNIEVRCGTQAAGWYADQWIALVDSHRLTKLRTRTTIFATGCIEQPAVFQNNDAPGVILGSAAQRLINLYAVQPFETAVVLTANSDGYRVALDLLNAGTKINAIVDMRIDSEPCEPGRLLADENILILEGTAVYEALPGAKGNSLKSVRVCPLEADGSLRTSAIRTIDCEGLVVSVGWAPNADVMAQSGAKFRYLTEIEQLVPRDLRKGTFAAGRVNGIYDLNSRLEDGRRAGLEAARYLGCRTSPIPIVDRSKSADCPTHPYPIFAHPGKKNFVDFDEDLHLIDFVNARNEGYDSVELLKRYSTVGMGPSQGKLSNMNAARILARLNGESLEKVGSTTSRPFHHPVSIAHLAGRRFHPRRQTPIQKWHESVPAKLVHVGPWQRPEYYHYKNLSSDECILREAKNVRERLGMIDISTLGKFLLHGLDAARFLEYVYTDKFAEQENGTLRYAMACDESGIISEEGLVARLAENRFYITSSTAGGATFYRELQRWALQFRMDVHLANVTGHWAAINLAGPCARDVLSTLIDVDIRPRAFSFGAARKATVAGAPAIVMRVGFVGELSYEIHLEATRTLDVWQALFEAGKKFGICPFGTEAQRLLRLEKGHLIAGHDTDALTTPFEAGLDRVVKMNKPFFVGKRSLEILKRKPLERQLVGFTLINAQEECAPEECQLIIHNGEIAGRVTSIAKRSTLGKVIGLAFVKPQLAMPGTRLQIKVAPNRLVDAVTTQLPFYDPEDSRQK